MKFFVLNCPLFFPVHRPPSILYRPSTRFAALGRTAVFPFQIDHEAWDFVGLGIEFFSGIRHLPRFFLPLGGEQHIVTAVFRVGAESEIVLVAFALETDGEVFLFRAEQKHPGRALRKNDLFGFASVHHFDLPGSDGGAAILVEVAVNRQVFGQVELDTFEIVIRPPLGFVEIFVKKSELRTAGGQQGRGNECRKINESHGAVFFLRNTGIQALTATEM